MSAQLLSVVPYAAQHRVGALWTRLMESGIGAHIERQHVALYKTIRAQWLTPPNGTNIAATAADDGGQVLRLCALVLGIGWSMAVLAFVVELVVAQ